MTKAEYKLIIVPGSYDDLGKILTKLGYKYKKTNSPDHACNKKLLSNCKALFVACGADLSVSNKNKDVIREYVRKGGAIYASDLASSFIDSVFPGKITFDSSSYDNGIKVNVKDPGLAEVIGSNINLHHDTEIHGVEKVSEGVQVLIEGPREKNARKRYPYLVLFHYGEGLVIYTVFHNSEQVSKTEKKLLNYLVFRPLMSSAATKAAQLVEAQMATPGKEIFASVDPGKTSGRYGVSVTPSATILYVLSWEEDANLGLQVWDPSGKLVKDENLTSSPISVEVPVSQGGTWSCAIQGKRVPYKNFPYVLTIATRSGGVTPPRVAVLPQQAIVASPPVVAVKQLPIFFVIDDSQNAAQMTAFIRAGLQYFLACLKDRISPKVNSMISLVLANSSGQMAVPLTSVTSFQAPLLTGQGLCGLGQALGNLLPNLAAQPSGTKPLVIILLAGPPSDNWMSAADLLRNLVTQGKANVFVFSLGTYTDAAVLGRLTTSQPLSLASVYPAYIQQTFDWMYSIVDVIMAGLEGGAMGRRSVPPPPKCLSQLES